VITAPDKNSDVVIARIVRARGIRGEVAGTVETDFPERFSSLDEITVWMPDDSRRLLKLQDHWFHKGRVILKFEGYDTMTEARKLVGARLVVDEADLERPAEGEFFEHQLIGSEAMTAGGQHIGEVTGLIRTGGTDLLVVKDQERRERLIPFADDICEVDATRKRITINPPEGLLDL
jgi:16S rRNA processing protein RimM